LRDDPKEQSLKSSRSVIPVLAFFATLSLAPEAATARTIRVNAPDDLQYRLARGRVVECVPLRRTALACTSPLRTGPYAVTGQLWTTGHSWNERVATRIEGTTAWAGAEKAGTEARVQQDGFLRALAQRVFAVTAGGDRVVSLVDGLGTAIVWRNGDVLAAPRTTEAQSKRAKYTAATDTMEIADGKRRTVISAWSTAAPTMQVFEGDTVVFTGP
jgi:hypothetical protein